ncbi:DUF423 domain-containing protein [Aliiglaciecola sp. CAU 1673]|uniref:DUF423 domain-containing protein n=1 Tax=Aliiglaciecola sp. CAU 1673 TaxID=3032595 RepID=UPI0023DC6F8B|nr:DUF423 domain-containing protein [Aliiglaciecola sp. CAU 1673]MDF2179400.1 DUF423 domain-containing protein [Aliiglaciecola sp. CAU 1673]
MNWMLALAAFFGMTGVMLGAFAAHGLKGRLDAAMLSAFQTGVQYQLWHALAVLLLVVLYRQQPQPLLSWAAMAMLTGILLFSGSLYLLALTGIKWFGPVTPMGGLCMILGWGLLLIAAFKGATH